MIRRFASLILAAAVVSACGTGAEPTDLPRADLIDEAVSRLGEDLEYFEVAADESGVTLVVRLVAGNYDAMAIARPPQREYPVVMITDMRRSRRSGFPRFVFRNLHWRHCL